jgi:hypothetical protein
MSRTARRATREPAHRTWPWQLALPHRSPVSDRAAAGAGTVAIGMPTSHRLVFVPLDQATVGPGYVKVRYIKKQVQDAPCIDTDGDLLCLLIIGIIVSLGALLLAVLRMAPAVSETNVPVTFSYCLAAAAGRASGLAGSHPAIRLDWPPRPLGTVLACPASRPGERARGRAGDHPSLERAGVAGRNGLRLRRTGSVRADLGFPADLRASYSTAS